MVDEVETRLRRTAGRRARRSRRRLRIAFGLSPVFLLVFLMLTDRSPGPGPVAPGQRAEMAAIPAADRGGARTGAVDVPPEPPDDRRVGEAGGSVAGEPAVSAGAAVIKAGEEDLSGPSGTAPQAAAIERPRDLEPEE